jgi:probable phosphoglycerate mutase
MLAKPKDTHTDSIAIAADASFFSSIGHETHFYLVRHGESEGNAKRTFQGRLDLPLAERGKEQARTVGAWLADKSIDCLYTSPLLRAAETARIVAQASGPSAQPRCDETFIEMDTGVFSGLGYDEAQNRFPEIFTAFRGQSWEAVPDAEKAEALYARAVAAWTLLRERAVSGDKALACISHSGFIQWMLRATFGCHAWMPLFSIANCAVFELVVAPTRSGLAYLQWRNINFQAPLGKTGLAAPRSAQVDQNDPFQIPR